MGDDGHPDESSREAAGPPSVATEARDELFRALAHPRRRRALAYLREERRAVPVEHVAKHVSAAEASTRPTSSSTDVVTALHHVHLPKLIEAGLLEWADADRRAAVRLTPLGRELPPVLPWHPDDGPEPRE